MGCQYHHNHDYDHDYDRDNNHDHNHTDSAGRRSARLLATILLNIVITVAEVAGGLYSGSLSLLSDALHNLSDGAALILSYMAVRVSGKASDGRRTFGYKRATILAAFINSAVLVAISLLLIKEACFRFITPRPVDGGVVLWVALVGLAANALGVLLLHGGSRKDLNIRAAYIHLFGDTVSSLGVVIAGIAIISWKTYWLDPLLTVVIGVYILKESFDIILRATNILMQGVPEGFDLDRVIAAMEETDGVDGVHHVHVWCLDERNVSLEAHVQVKDKPLSETGEIRKQIERLLYDSHGINHVTLQFEQQDCSEHCSWASEQRLRCPG